MEITTRIRSGQGDFVRFAITPPRQSTPAERLPEIARATVERLDHLVNDGLVLYDIDEERSRNPVERPFPFSPTVDPPEYRAEHLQAWRTPAIVYRAVGKYPREELRTWLTERAEGKKSLEAIRCLKRRISDAIYRQWSQTPEPPPVTALKRVREGTAGRLKSPARSTCPRTSTLRISHFPDPRAGLRRTG